MSEWSYLPNAKHIDWVLASLKANPMAWDAARDAVGNVVWVEVRLAAWDAAWDAAWNAARIAARNAAGDATWDAVQGAARIAAGDAERQAARYAAWDAILALVAYDHCEKYLDMSPDELFIWWKLSADPACLLLMPMISVLRMEMEKEMA